MDKVEFPNPVAVERLQEIVQQNYYVMAYVTTGNCRACRGCAEFVKHIAQLFAGVMICNISTEDFEVFRKQFRVGKDSCYIFFKNGRIHDECDNRPWMVKRILYGISDFLLG